MTKNQNQGFFFFRGRGGERGRREGGVGGGGAMVQAKERGKLGNQNKNSHK